MKALIPGRVLFHLYGLPLFFFPLSTAGSGISLGLLFLAYLGSGYWQRWRILKERSWALPWGLLVAWTLLGLLWTADMGFGQKVAVATLDAVFAYMGATLPWTGPGVRSVIRWFLAGILLNEAAAFLMTWKVLPWSNVGHLPFTGFCGHIFLSLAIAHAVLWLVYDQKWEWNFPRWTNLLLIVLLCIQLALTPARSGQLLLLVLVPAALFLLYPGRWRLFIPPAGLVAVLLLLLVPEIRAHFLLGIHQLVHFSPDQANVHSSWGIRMVAMWGGALLFLEHPLFGVGTGDFYREILHLQSQHMIPATPGFIMNTAANSYLSVAASLGVVGLVFFLWMLVALGRECWHARRTAAGWFAMGYLAIYVVGGLFNSMNWGYADAITIALMAGLPLAAAHLGEAS